MHGKGQTSRRRIVDAATSLFYQRGYQSTSLSDVGQACGIPKGNFYYYFKSKDDLLAAVLDVRRNQAAARLADCQLKSERPHEQLACLVGSMLGDEEAVLSWGCPLGSLSIELGRLRPEQGVATRRILDLYVTWAEERFRALGHGERARALATHLLAMVQGAAVLGSAYGEADLLVRERQQIHNWLQGI